MADNMVAGLFGLTPEMYGEQQRISALNEGINLAKLNPSARGTAMIYGGAKGLGNAIGGLMGVEDPQLKMISQTNQLMQGLNLRDPQSLEQAAVQANQMGNTPLAFKLLELADNAQVRAQQAEAQRQALQTQRQAQLAQRIAQSAYQPGGDPTMFGKPTEYPLMDDEGNVMPGAGVSEPSYDIRRVAPQLQALGAPGMAQLTSALAAQKALRPETVSLKEGERIYSVPTESGQPYKEVATGGEKPRPFTGNLANAANILYRTDDPAKIFEKYGQPGLDAVEKRAAVIAESVRPVTNISAPVTVQMQKNFGANLTEDLTANLRAGRVAGSTLGTIQSMKALIEEGTRTGFGQETMLQLGRAGQLFDPNFKIAGVAGGEAFQSYSNAVILPEVKKLGVNPTDTDLKFIVQGSPSLSKSPQGNLILLDTLELKLKREQDLARFSNRWLAQNAQLVERNPITAQTQFNDAFENYTANSPLYAPQAEVLRQRMNELQTMGAGRTPTPAKSTLQRGGFVN
jgi:hypothetical protein